jgi:hypothetical protein
VYIFNLFLQLEVLPSFTIDRIYYGGSSHRAINRAGSIYNTKTFDEID